MAVSLPRMRFRLLRYGTGWASWCDFTCGGESHTRRKKNPFFSRPCSRLPIGDRKSDRRYRGNHARTVFTIHAVLSPDLNREIVLYSLVVNYIVFGSSWTRVSSASCKYVARFIIFQKKADGLYIRT